MLEAPNLSIEALAVCVAHDYGFAVRDVSFLPLGADVNTAVFRVTATDGTRTFLKLRRGPFDETSVTLPACLVSQGIAHIIPILHTTSGALWTRFDGYTVILYPFVEGRDGYQVALTPTQWREFGAAMRQIHTAHVPPAILTQIPVEQYSPRSRSAVLQLMGQLDDTDSDDAITQALVAFLRAKHAVVADLVARAQTLAELLRTRAGDLIVCHSDIHAGNLLIESRGNLFIVDWDNPIRALKERDLMYFGGKQGFLDVAPEQEEAMFYAGYGPAEIDSAAIAYYRYERIVQDIDSFCAALLSSSGEGEDRRQSLYYLKSNFSPGSTIDNAYSTDKSGLWL